MQYVQFAKAEHEDIACFAMFFVFNYFSHHRQNFCRISCTLTNVTQNI